MKRPTDFPALHKGNPLCHQAGDEGDVARQPVELRYYDGEFVLARSSERGCKLWPPFHHLSRRIPYYRLPEALRDHPELRNVGRLTLFESLKAVRLVLWDEEQRRLISFAEARTSA